MIRLFTLLMTAMLVGLPIGVSAHIAWPGRPILAPPPLSYAMAVQLIESYLARTPPTVRFLLRQPIDERHVAAYSDMVRAGLLKIVDKLPAGPRYDITQKGAGEIPSGFFVFGHQVDPYSEIPEEIDFVEVPVGQFRYVRGTGVLHYFHGYGNDPLPEFTFSYSFKPNQNADMLLRLGPARDFVIANYGFPQRALADIGRNSKQTLSIRACHVEWVVPDPPPYFRAQCNNA